MRISGAAVMVGLVMLIGALPASGQPRFELRSGSAIRLAADDNTAADRNAYVQKAQGEMEEWQKKLHEFGEEAKAKGQEAGSSADKGLNEAWVKTKEASRKLQTVGAEGWQGAKSSYEKATQNLSATWNRIHSGDH